jgi:hypothetical protein
MHRSVKLQRPDVLNLKDLQLAIGDVRALITSRDPALTLTVPSAVARFIGDSDQYHPDIHIHAQWRTSERPARGRELFDSGGLWRLHDEGARLTWSFTSAKFGAIPYKVAVMERDFSAGEVFLHRPYFDAATPIYPLEYPLDELLVTNWLSQGRGIEIHGCAVRDADGAGYLFTGHSGAGKTTIARLWMDLPGVTVLSDDRIILRKSGSQIMMYGTPWHGDEPLASPTSVPLTRGFVLHHAARNELANLKGATAVAELLARSFPPFSSGPGLDYSLAFLNDATQSAPFAALGFIPDTRLPDFVRSL